MTDSHLPLLPWTGRLPLGAGLLLLVLLTAGRGHAAPVVLPASPPGPKAAGPAPRTPLLTLQGHTGGIFHITYSPDGRYLATSSKDHTVKLWDAATGKELRTFTGHTSDVYSSAFSPDGRLLASAGEDRTVRLWDMATGKALRTCAGHSGEVYNVAFSPDGRRLASCSRDESVRLWDVATGRMLHNLQGHTNRVITVAFSPDGERLVSACGTSSSGGSSAGGEVKVWDLAGGRELFSLGTGNLGVIGLAFSPDGKRLAGACLKQTVQVWEMATGHETLTLKGHSLEVYNVAFSPDGRRLASCSGKWNQDRGGEVKLWDLAAGRELLSFRPHATPIWAVAFSRDGRRLATASGRLNKSGAGEAKVWDLGGLPRDPPAPPSTRKELEALWSDLAGGDAARAYRAVWALSAAPRQSVPFLAEQVRPVAGAVNDERIARLVADLDDNSFAVRAWASAELEKLGSAAHPALHKALESPSLEVRRRAEELLENKGAAPPLTAEELRALRAIEVLQHIGTPEVRPVLEKLARGPTSSPVSRDAAAALRRLPLHPLNRSSRTFHSTRRLVPRTRWT